MIKQNTIVKLIYELYVGEPEIKEELMERATEDYPLVYCHGRGMMLPMFEQNLEGKQVGDNFDFVIDANDAYGEYEDEAVLTLDKSMFCIDGEFDEDRVFVGNIIPMNTAEGQIINAQVVDITENGVTIDLNHPLAGERLHFVGKILDEHPATQEEIANLTHKCGGCCSGKSDCENKCDNGCSGGCNGCQND